MRRSLAILATAAATTAVAAPPALAARAVTFRASVEATQTTTWTEPRHLQYIDCFHRSWTQGRGSETVRLRSRRPMVVTVHGMSGYALFTYGSATFGPGDAASNGIPLHGAITRHGSIVHGADPGECGGGSPSSDTGPYDCGTRTGRWRGVLRHDRGRLGLLAIRNGATVDFRDCPMSYPDGVTQAGLTEITQRFPVRDLLDPAIGKHIVLANRTYRRKTTGLRFGGYLEARTNVHWKITLTRVRARR